MYNDSNVDAVELIVMEVLTLSNGIFSKQLIISLIELIATPVLPTSPSDCGSSESRPVCVGKSKANDNPVCPCSSKNLNLLLVSSALPNPLYCRIVHKRSRYMFGYRPRVYGNLPGSSSFIVSNLERSFFL